MSVLDTFAGEHAVFERLIQELQDALRQDEDSARRALRDTLLILIPALESHEKLEDLVFSGAVKKGAGKAISELNKEHWRIALLRRELLEAMKDSWEFPFDKLSELMLKLVCELRQHFLMEERRLWPRYRELAGRSAGRALERRAQLQLKRLLGEVQRRREALTECGGARP